MAGRRSKIRAFFENTPASTSPLFFLVSGASISSLSLSVRQSRLVAFFSPFCQVDDQAHPARPAGLSSKRTIV
jgi:hypothetical protein